MPKNLVVCCDGTANEFARHRTNVIKLFSVLDHDSQRTYYHPGLGTMEPAGALTTPARKVTKLMGMTFGYGLRDDVRDAYVFLMRYYEPGDRVFMFGFSRGAYTVRAVASLLHMYGMIRPGNEPLVPYAIRMLLAINRRPGVTRRVVGKAGELLGLNKKTTSADEHFGLAADFKAEIGCLQCGPHFVGVWDTVSSVGWIENPLTLPYVADNPSIQIGRHAVAIDERRAFFRNHLWRPSPGRKAHGPRDSMQVWFPGVHCDVGGGYRESESGLSKLALEWMLTEAKKAGLLVIADREADVLGRTGGSTYVQPNAKGKQHESLEGWWHFGELIWKKHYNWKRQRWERRMNLWRRRTIPPASFIHESAYGRSSRYISRLPADAVRVSTVNPGTPSDEVARVKAAEKNGGHVPH